MTEPQNLMFPFGRVPGGTWRDGELKSLDGCEVGPVQEDDVEKIVHFWETPDEWDGSQVAVLKLKDGRYVGYEAWYGPTGDSFNEDAYGGDGVLYFARDMATIVRFGLGDESRKRLGIKLEEEGPSDEEIAAWVVEHYGREMAEQVQAAIDSDDQFGQHVRRSFVREMAE